MPLRFGITAIEPQHMKSQSMNDVVGDNKASKICIIL